MASALDAFYCVIQQPVWANLCLRGNPTNPHSRPVAVHLHAAITRTSEHVTAQLTAGACLTQLCKAEVVYKQSNPGVRVRSLYCQQAMETGCMAALVGVMEQAVHVSRCCRSSNQFGVSIYLHSYSLHAHAKQEVRAVCQTLRCFVLLMGWEGGPEGLLAQGKAEPCRCVALLACQFLGTL